MLLFELIFANFTIKIRQLRRQDMARTKREKLDYFPIDTDIFTNSRKVKLLRGKYPCVGFELLVILWSKIYGGKNTGYYFVWTNEELTLIASDMSLPEEKVSEILEYMVKCGLFSTHIFTKFSTLTSESVQRQYIEIKKNSEEIQIIKDFQCFVHEQIPIKERNRLLYTDNPYLIAIKSDLLPIISDLTPIIPHFVPKVKESKDKEREKENANKKFLSLSESDYPVLVEHFWTLLKTPQYRGGEKDAERMAMKFSGHIESKYGNNLPFRGLDQFLANATIFAMNER